MFLLKNQLLALWELFCMLLLVSPLLPLRFSLCLLNWHFNYDVSWSRPILVHLNWDHLCLLNLHVFSPLQVWKVFCCYFFKQGFYPLLLFFSFWYCYGFWIRMLLCFMLPFSSLKLSSYFLNLFSCSCSTRVFLSTFSSSSLIQSSGSSSLLVIPSRVCVCVCVCV